MILPATFLTKLIDLGVKEENPKQFLLTKTTEYLEELGVLYLSLQSGQIMDGKLFW